ncbi:MAG: 4Fe-4S dicluster domain-containing protein [Treponema sp.]|jgi:anaerobic dimethyl sulfoxide reductase subunit B (iron-sulfur subunit)|nr:4Fe-4S dicluster domain-containing protein [Treponema sp.]
MALGFYIDTNKCIGCRACHIACKDLNDLNLGPIFRKIRSFETGTYPNVDGYRFSGSCNHCENAPCVRVCPTNALHYAADGTVQLNADQCIACKACLNSCPYGAMQFIADRGVAGKCDSCKSSRDLGGNPVCVDSCLMRCLDFGDLAELQAKYGPGLTSDLPILPPSNITNPRLLIKVKPSAQRSDFREVEI